MTILIDKNTVTQRQASLTSPSDLIANKLASETARTRLNAVADRYPISITPFIASLIKTPQPDYDPPDDDPIARQFIPDIRELDQLPQEDPDPIGDARFSPLPQLVHRYPDRVLLKVVSVCPVYCRFCFRREMVGPGGASLSGDALTQVLDYIASRPKIFEVILTGGDPFMLSARRAHELTTRLAAISHVRVIRWHTRVPMVDPARVTPAFVHALKTKGVSTWVAIHANHAREFAAESEAAIARLANAGIALVSQSVLLNGVNNSADDLENLMRKFVSNGVKPYYLHHPDLAPGTAHFRLSVQEGQALVDELRARATGLAQPTYVLDVPGGSSKAPIAASFVRETLDGLEIRDGSVWRDYHG